MAPARRLLLGAVTLLFAAAPRDARARDEGILEVHADLTISPDATVTADQTILIWVSGARIKQGITWELPTRYASRPGDPEAPAARAAIDDLRITRDGQPEPFTRTETEGGAALRLQLGTPAVTLEPGTHVYVISYRSRGQIARAKDDDRLYAPVIAGGRDLVINQAAVVLHLPQEVTVPIDSLTGFVIGAADAGAPPGAPPGVPTISGDRRGDSAVVTMTRALRPDEGLAVLGTWPKGLVRAPTPEEQVTELLRDNRPLVLTALALLAQALFWLGASGLLEGPLTPRAAGTPAAPAESVPDGLSPAALRFALRGRADATALAAALLGLEAKGEITIARADGGVFVVSRGGAATGDGGDSASAATSGGAGAAASPLAVTGDEQAVASALFRERAAIRLEPRSGDALAAARGALRIALAGAIGDRYWIRAGGHRLPALAFTLAGAIALAAGTTHGGRAATVVLGAALALWTALGTSAVVASARLWLRARRARGARPSLERAAAGSAAALAILAVELTGLVALAFRASPVGAALLAAIGVADYLLARRTLIATSAGRAVVERAAAYRRFISAAPASVRAGPGAGGLLPAYALALDLDAPRAEHASRAFVAAVLASSASASASAPG